MQSSAMAAGRFFSAGSRTKFLRRCLETLVLMLVIRTYVATGGNSAYQPAFSVGPVSIHSSARQSATERRAEAAHERQHRTDFWTLQSFRMSREQLEQRGFAAELPVYENRIHEIESHAPRSTAERAELLTLRQHRDQAHSIATDPLLAKVYCESSEPRFARLGISTIFRTTL
ncbi:MAG TPA: hypothetical protein VE994_03055 [Terriglobales bacterium]|nr:hypothetical protein [Terriglobales bacterium]